MSGFDSFTDATSHQLRADLRVALIGAVVAALIMGGIVFAVGRLSQWEAKSLLEAALPTIRFLCSSLMTATATTLALMLTLISLASRSEREIKGSHFERIRQIASVNVVAFVGATLLLAVLIVPFNEASDIPPHWYKVIYYAVTIAAALLSGVLVAVMLLLYAAVRDLIRTVGPSDEAPLYDEDAAEDAAEEAEEAAEEAEDSAERAEASAG